MRPNRSGIGAALFGSTTAFAAAGATNASAQGTGWSNPFTLAMFVAGIACLAATVWAYDAPSSIRRAWFERRWNLSTRSLHRTWAGPIRATWREEAHRLARYFYSVADEIDGFIDTRQSKRIYISSR